MLRLIRLGCFTSLVLALGAIGSCDTAQIGGSSGCSPELLAPADELLSDTTGETLAKAVSEYVPTDDELKLVAAYWALLAVGFEDGEIAPAFFEARLDEHVAALMARYPSFVSCPEGSSGSSSQLPFGHALATTSDCPCGASCLPAASEVGSVLVDLGGLGLDVFSKTPKAAALVQKLRFYANDVVTKVALAKDVKEALGQGFSTHDATKAIIDGVSKDDALNVLQGVGEFVVVAGTIAEAAAIVGASAPALATIAAVGAVVSAGMVGVKIGSKLGVLMDSYQACSECQAATCGEGPSGCTPECTGSEVCIDGSCVEKSSATTCELREPSCCPGQDDSCTAPDSACFCDAYCVTAGDCCPDACNVCGFCG